MQIEQNVKVELDGVSDRIFRCISSANARTQNIRNPVIDLQAPCGVRCLLEQTRLKIWYTEDVVRRSSYIKRTITDDYCLEAGVRSETASEKSSRLWALRQNRPNRYST